MKLTICSFKIDIQRFVFYIALLTPAMPKLKIAEGVTVYLLEIFLIVFFPFLFRNLNKFRFQTYLLGMWGLIFVGTIMSSFDTFDLGGFLRVIKGFLYVPLGAMGFKFFKDRELNLFLWIGALSSVLNLVFLVQNITLYGFNIWDVRTIGAGLSNRFIALPSFELGTIESGAHGIWGNYCAMLIMLAIYQRMRIRLSLSSFIVIVALSLVGIGMSVSREAMITVLMLVVALLRDGISVLRLKIKKHLFAWILLSVLVLGGLIYLYGDQIPIIQKLFYTIQSVDESGTESNIQLRINGWLVYFESLLHNPEKIITGYGFNLDYYAKHLGFAHNRLGFSFVALPESYFIFAACFGGIVALFFAILFFWEIFSIALKCRDSELRNLIIFFFLGLLIGNTLSGASILSDLLYGQVLLFLGYLKSLERNENKVVVDKC